MLVLPRTVRDALVAHAREGEPNEICGILSGTRGNESRVERAHRTENVADTPRVTYAIDPAEQLELMEEIDENGREVVGFYHSHPDGPDEPSATDAARATWPDYLYVIVSLQGAEPLVGAWRWTGETFEREAVEVR